MRTHKATFGTLHTLVGIPYRYPCGDAPMFIGSCPHRHGPVRGECRYRYIVPITFYAWCMDFLYKILYCGVLEDRGVLW